MTQPDDELGYVNRWETRGLLCQQFLDLLFKILGVLFA